MDAGMNIESFNAAMRAEGEDQLMETLRELTALEKPEDVRLLKEVTPDSGWTGWAY